MSSSQRFAPGSRLTRIVGLLTAMALFGAPLSAQQRRAPAPVKPLPTFDNLLSVDSYEVYGEVRNVGQLLSTGGAGEIADPQKQFARHRRLEHTRGCRQFGRALADFVHPHVITMAVTAVALVAEQQIRAFQLPVSYVAIGPVFATSTKDTGYSAVGLEGVESAAHRASAHGLPVVAIGGIDASNAADRGEVDVRAQQAERLSWPGRIPRHALRVQRPGEPGHQRAHDCLRSSANTATLGAE